MSPQEADPSKADPVLVAAFSENPHLGHSLDQVENPVLCPAR